MIMISFTESIEC